MNGFLVQIEEGFVLNVAGGLLLEHPLTSRFVEAVVSFFLHVTGAMDFLHDSQHNTALSSLKMCGLSNMHLL